MNADDKSLFEQINIKPILTKRRIKTIEVIPPVINSNFFLEGEQGITSLFKNNDYEGLYIDDQATVKNTALLQNVGSMILNSVVTTTGFLQDVVSKKPIVNQENNIRYVEFDGVDDLLLGSLPTKSFFNNATCHGFSIAFKMSLGRGVFCWSNPRGSSNSRGFALRIVGTRIYVYANNWATSSDTLFLTSNITTTNWNVLTCQVDYTQGTFRLWQNNTLIKSDVAPIGPIYSGSNPTIMNMGFIQGGSEYGAAKIAKISFWRNPLSDTALQRVRTGMGSSIGLTL